MSGEIDLLENLGDVKVVVHQNEYMEREHQRVLADRDKMDTLPNLR